MKAGFDFRTLHDAGTPLSGPTSLTFSPVFTQQQAQSTTYGTGASLATMLLGYPTAGNMSVVTNFDDFVRYYGGFVQDDFRVTPKLTLNFGLRLEHESGIREENNKLIVGFDTATPNPLQQNVSDLSVPGNVEYAGVNGNPSQTGNPLAIKPAPRFGFAYSLDDKTVIRGGYGIFWAPVFFNFQNAIGYSQTTSIVATTNSYVTPSATLSNPYPNGLLEPTGNTLGGLSGIGQAITVFSPKTQSSGYVQQYSLEIQRQIPAGFVLTVGALGSHSLDLLESGQNIRPTQSCILPARICAYQIRSQSVLSKRRCRHAWNSYGKPRTVIAAVSSIHLRHASKCDQGAARYYSFYFRAQKRFSNGLNLLASYTLVAKRRQSLRRESCRHRAKSSRLWGPRMLTT